MKNDVKILKLKRLLLFNPFVGYYCYNLIYFQAIDLSTLSIFNRVTFNYLISSSRKAVQNTSIEKNRSI